MGLKSYFRKPASKDVQLPEIEEPPSGTFTPMAWTSHTPSSQEPGDAQAIAMSRLNDARCELLVNHLWSQQVKLLWYAGDDEGVIIKQSRGKYVCCPPDLCSPDGFYDAIQALNVKVCPYSLMFETHTKSSSECHDD
jgi:hypothetical protein